MINAKDFSNIVNKRDIVFEESMDVWLESIASPYRDGERTFKLPNLDVGEVLKYLLERGFHVSNDDKDRYDYVTIFIPPQAR
jgi:hypothetical protein